MHRSTARQSTSARSALYASYSADPGSKPSQGSYGSPPDEYTWITCLPSGHTEGSTRDGMKKEHRFCESCRLRDQSWTTRCAASWMCDRSRPSASMATNRCMMAPCRGSVLISEAHEETGAGCGREAWSAGLCRSSRAVSKGVRLETTALRARTSRPLRRRTPAARPPSLRMASTWALSSSVPPWRSSPRTRALAISQVPPRGTEKAALSSKKRSRM
mmetsp:Transcript_12885/g.43657  ORF Transcript_12885/g.43657 Transcript_12885/m.43657 type:complete len:217 (-) Transcript_12885:867-1517(-)